MIILHRQQVIFVRCRKTASTSLEIELSKLADENDVITPISPRDELIRIDAGGKTAQNYSENQFYNHIPANEITKKIDNNIWKSYFKFCVERNPWDKIVSMYFHRLKRRKEKQTFNEFIESGEFLDARNWHLYTQNGKPILDFIAKYENLNNDLFFVFNKFNKEFKGLSTNAKSQFRPSTTAYKDLFNKKNRDLVYETFHDEIKFHDYKF